MPTNPSNKEVSTTKLLQATANLSSLELENFVSQAIILRTKRHASSVSHDETELLLKINQGLPSRLQKRFDELAEKLQMETMNAEEREDFLRLTNRIEKQDAQRIELLGKLAEIRQQSLDEVMRDLGLLKIKICL